MNVKCLACGKAFVLDQAVEGAKTYCTYCGKLLKIVHEKPPICATLEIKTNKPERSANVISAPVESLPEPRSVAEASHRMPLVITAGIIAAVIVFALCLWEAFEQQAASDAIRRALTGN